MKVLKSCVGTFFFWIIFLPLASLAQFKGGEGDGFDVIQQDNVQIGVQEFKELKSIKLFPNPVKSGEVLSLEINEEQWNQEVEVRNAQGAIVKPLKTGKIKDFRINTQGLIPGNYTIHFLGTRQFAKFVVR